MEIMSIVAIVVIVGTFIYLGMPSSELKKH